jgi:solute carrier family 8 (sodium/calcium exchanger)
MLLPYQVVRFKTIRSIIFIPQFQVYGQHFKISRYLRLMKDKELPLILSGDGRADTPGHSAKYGSYAMLDLNLMMVVDFQLVQVESFIL